MTFEARLYAAALLEADRILRSGVLTLDELAALMETLKAIHAALVGR